MHKHTDPGESEVTKRAQPAHSDLTDQPRRTSRDPFGGFPVVSQRLGAPSAVLSLQRQVGNSAVMQLLAEGAGRGLSRPQPGSSADSGIESHVPSSSNGPIQRAPQEITVNPGVMTGASKKMADTIFYEWNWAVTVGGQAYIYNDWIDTNDPDAEPELRQTVRERLEAGHRNNLQGIL